MAKICAGDPGGSPPWPPLGSELCEKLLELLGLKDTSGNGLPDFLDELLRPLLDCLKEWLEDEDNEWDWHWDPQELFDLFPHLYPDIGDDDGENRRPDVIDRDPDPTPIDPTPIDSTPIESTPMVPAPAPQAIIIHCPKESSEPSS